MAIEWNYKVISTKDIGKGSKLKRKVVQITRKDGKPDIKPKHVQTLLKKIGETIPANEKFVVKGVKADKITTIKSYKTSMDSDFLDDYYEGLVKDPAKFQDYAQLLITTYG